MDDIAHLFKQTWLVGLSRPRGVKVEANQDGLKLIREHLWVWKSFVGHILMRVIYLFSWQRFLGSTGFGEIFPRRSDYATDWLLLHGRLI
jgi:hypothetical protein